ncbi:relaxase/mobilization nuclease domain-containing protein [Ruminococcus sp. YE78]|uniref:relaxase/mobilization nuclease domain-containing protein n=1 Tax=Ruminococcus sp. YE78 TaxID=1352374 RepID=UPI001FA6BE1D|nr:relaxase/mobilization nuclease domain-containing protein [Ruminococcus sp. YE78]
MHYTTSLNCTTDPYEAYLQMKAVYEQYSGHRFDSPKPKKGRAHVKTIHYIMSFADSENVSPELAFKIAKTLVIKAFGKDVQAVIAVHTDKSHVHAHFAINTYSLTGHKYNANMRSLHFVREKSNEVCRMFGVTPALNFEGEGRSISHYEWEQQKNGTSWKECIRNEIDDLLPTVNTVEELLAALERRRFIINRGKYISVTAPGKKRSVRLKTLGEDYTEESLKARILWRAVGNIDNLHFTNTEIERAYIDVLGDVRILADERRKVPRRYDTERPYGTDNDLDCYRLSAQIAVMNWDHISSISDLKNRIIKLSAEIKKEHEEYSAVLLEQERVQTLIEQSDYYFANTNRTDLSAEEFARLQTYRTAVYENNIMTQADRIMLKRKNESLMSKISDMKERLTKKRNKLVRYVDIRDTYDQISNPGYFMSPSTARNWLKHFTDKNHLSRIHPHQFRHTAISLQLQNGISIPEAAKRAGHSRPDVTLRTYSHTLKDNDRHCCEVVTKAIPKMPKRKTG